MASNWSSTWDDGPSGPPLSVISPDEQDLILEARRCYKYGLDWEATARVNFDYDYKFANGDTHNKYQWDSDNDLISSRQNDGKPCLTVNKTQQHNLMIINDARQNKPGIRIRPVGDEASFEAAQVYQELVYHIEYISSAENIYDSATKWQVEAGIGYWRVITDYISPRSFDQEIYIKHIKDPRSVYLDPDINEVDGSDARWGIVFEDVPNAVFKAKYPKFAQIVGTITLNNTDTDNTWITKDHVKVAEFFKKTQIEDKLITFISPNNGAQVLKLVSELDEFEELVYKELKGNKQAKALYQYKEREVIIDNVKWYKIAGDRIIEENDWPGKYIPIVRLPGTETVIDGVLDRKGHTRALINPQQIYNISSSSNVEFWALQSKVPLVAATAAIEGYEEYYKTSNIINHSYLPYNHIDEDGNPIPAPTRPVGPQSSPAYVQQLQIAQNEMMMASGQYQAQFGENENAKSGVAINARQRQGDRATYHFIDNQAIAIRFTGKIIIDLIPKIYDTKRVRRITATDGSILDVTIDPNADQAYEKVNQDQPQTDKNQKIIELIFNPNVGMYDIQSDTGPSFATKRMEAAAALTQIAAADKEFMQKGGDIFFETLDFPKADILAQRYRKMLPPELRNEDGDPAVEQLMQQASQHIEQLTAENGQLAQKLADKEKELTIKAQSLDLEHKKAISSEARLDYDAETKRLTALGNAGPGISMEQIQPVLKQLIIGMMQNGELSLADMPGPHEGGTPIQLPQEPTGEAETGEEAAPSEDDAPPMPGARKSIDGNFYVENNGQWYRIDR